MERGGENLGLHEDDIYNKLPSEYKQYFQPESTEKGNRAKRAYSTIGQRKRRKKGGFGFGYHRDYHKGSILFIERWIPSNPPTIPNWKKLKTLANKKNWDIFISPRKGATSIILKLEKLSEKKIIDAITSFLNTISMEELDFPFLEAAQKKKY